jgi:hypothetical protein
MNLICVPIVALMVISLLCVPVVALMVITLICVPVVALKSFHHVPVDNHALILFSSPTLTHMHTADVIYMKR